MNFHIEIVRNKELPKDIQKMVKMAKLSKEQIEQNFDILLNIIHFQTKIKFKSVEEKKKQWKIEATDAFQPPQTLDPRPRLDGCTSFIEFRDFWFDLAAIMPILSIANH